MGQLGLMFALKIVSLLAATAQTVGFIGLFAFEALDPYKWHLLIGGTLAIAMSEGMAYLLAKRWAKSGEARG
jgi:uncharacterized membrane protein